MEMKKLIEVMEQKKRTEATRSIPKKRGRPRKVVDSKEEPVVQEPTYTLSLTLGDMKYESQGASVLEALEKIETPSKIFVKGFVKVTHGDKTTERMFFPAQMKRFLYPVARVLVAKALMTTLK